MANEHQLTTPFKKLRELEQRLTGLLTEGKLGVAFARDEILSLVEAVRLCIDVRLGHWVDVELHPGDGTCRVCGCTDDDCSQCVEKTGAPCHWLEPDLCSACAGDDAEYRALGIATDDDVRRWAEGTPAESRLCRASSVRQGGRCDHKFVDSTVCLKCGVHVDELRAADAAERAASELRAAVEGGEPE